jgi:hypothetical protein
MISQTSPSGSFFVLRFLGSFIYQSVTCLVGRSLSLFMGIQRYLDISSLCSNIAISHVLSIGALLQSDDPGRAELMKCVRWAGFENKISPNLTGAGMDWGHSFFLSFIPFA